MNKIYLFIAVFNAAGALCAQTGRGGNSLGLGFQQGLLSVRGEEIVYRNSVTKEKLSQLYWDSPALVFVGADINYGWMVPESKTGIFAEGSFKYGIPGKGGTVEDRDWMDNNDISRLTNFSVSGNRTDMAVIAAGKLGGQYAFFDKLRLKYCIGYRYMYFEWAAVGGYWLYAPTTLNPTPSDGRWKNEDVMTYKQEWHSVFVGASIYGVLNSRFDTELGVNIGLLGFGRSEDHHILRNLVITENFYEAFAVETDFVFSYNISKYFKLSLVTEVFLLSEARGDSKYSDYAKGTEDTYNNIGGAGVTVTSVGLQIRLRLGGG